MAERYSIGRFEFDTYREYVRGLEDVRKIDEITHSVDIYDADTAARIYEAVRNGKIRFYSKIGRQFILDITDIMAENTREGIAASDKKNRKRHRKPEKQSKKKQQLVVHTDRGRRVLGTVCLVAAIICFIWYFWTDYTNRNGNAINDYLKMLEQDSGNSVEMVSNDTFFQENSPELVRSAEEAGENAQEQPADPLKILEEYEAIYGENQDFAGWIQIEGTHVDYPVMLKKSDPDFYLNRDFYGGEDLNGTLFMDARTDLYDRSANVIIYGHNMKSGQMFGDLKKYLNEDFWKEHKKITFNTIYEKGTYEIFAVCRAKVLYQHEEGFRYYDFVEAENEEAYQDFIQNIMQLSVFADEKLPAYGEELLTLSTCNNYVEGGRLFLVAKKCKDTEE